MRRLLFALALAAVGSSFLHAADANRFAYLDGGLNPYYVHRTFPKLTTPQWIGEEGVEAVVILSIDDMREPKKYEDYLRPVLNRLKKIDGRAPVSIMSCQVKPEDAKLQEWLKEGLSLETHTFDHPCPLLGKGDLDKARGTYDRCVDLLSEVPNSRPVAFRTPCCDSLNTLSPRFLAEIFHRTTSKGNFLTIDSSVFNIFTANDPALPRDLVLDADGQERFRKYVPTDRGFVNTIEDYPYPYVIGRGCWEIPCVAPSDWSAQHRHKPNNPVTVRDWKAALDATVIKQGVFCLVFHPHGWIKNDQLVELIDHAVEKHGRKVKFLNFKEVQERLDKNLLGGQPLRHPKTGKDNGVRLLDVADTGTMGVVIGNDKVQKTRVWSKTRNAWLETEFPVKLVTADGEDTGARFGFLGEGRTGRGKTTASVVLASEDEKASGAWHYTGGHWGEERFFGKRFKNEDGTRICAMRKGVDQGLRLLDLLGTGECQIILSNPKEQRILGALDITLPPGAIIVNAEGKDNGVRFIDIDEDGHLDILFSNEEGYGLYLFKSMKEGWSRKALAGKPGDKQALPLIARKGQNMGAWFHSRSLVVQNEDTAILKDLVDRRAFNDLLVNADPMARTPMDSLRSIRTRPGFTAELMASEPFLGDPIAFAWGPDGKLWVVEMGDYPLGIDGKGKPGGRVLYLEDTQNNGVYDKATVFLEGLSFPTSVLPWRKGILITCAPDIIYAESTTGKGRADKREVLFQGFREGNQQHRVNTLAWGLDGWVHCANGDSGGTVKSMKTGKTVDIRGRDFRINPDTGDIDLLAGQTQYGRSRDDWGNWFGNNNSNPMWHYALEDRYLRRNPHVAFPEARVHLVPGAIPVFPVSRTVTRPNNPQAANHFTSACSAIVYRDELFGPAFAGNMFVSEPVHNLVHRQIVASQGATFTARRASDEQQAEFLASTDNWFRPTSLQTGPDGALWIADMYRLVIEHPEWIPKEMQARVDLRAGHDMGRIYRTFPVGSKPRAIPRLDKLDTASLVAALDSPGGWQRDTAQMMLVWKADRAAVPLLEKLAVDSKRPLARLHALCTLDNLRAVTPALALRALGDEHPGVRSHAIRLCEPLLAKSPELGVGIVKLSADADAHVRLQAAYTLGEWDDPRAAEALGKRAVRDAGDRFISAAILSSLSAKNLDGALRAALADDPKVPPPPAMIESLLRLATALNHGKATIALLTSITTLEKDRPAPWQRAALAGLLDSLDQRGSSLKHLHDGGGDELKATLQRTGPLFQAARAALANNMASSDDQLLALRLVGRGLDRQKEDLDLLVGLLTPQTPGELQTAAVGALGRLRDAPVPELLIRNWKGLGPALRTHVLDTLFRRDDWLRATLDAIEKKQIAAAELDAIRRQRLLEHKDEAIRKRAAQVLAGAIAPDRQKVIDAYKKGVALQGDAARGAQIFTKNCATCHRLGTVGHVVGPDLAGVGDKTPEGLLIAILDPNRVVESRYVNYTAFLKNGVVHTGILASETGTSITLLAAEGKQQVILRTDLDELVSTGKSAMPEGLEKEIPAQDMADLIAHVRAASPLPRRKAFDGNKPETIKPAADGSLLLTAANSEIYGTTLVFEKKYANLGHWNSDDDHAVWVVDAARSGRYAVTMDYACADASGGKAWVLRGGAADLTGKVEGTGNWDTYRQAKVGEVVLSAGTQRLTFRAANRLASSSLIDLKSLKLVRVESPGPPPD